MAPEVSPVGAIVSAPANRSRLKFPTALIPHCDWRSAAVTASAIALALQASASLQAQSPTFRSGTRVVSIFATVTDAQKRLVPDLTQDEFEIYDNEKLQPIVLFENRIQPISVVVMLDTSLSLTGSMKLLQEAAEQFVLRLLPDDKAKVGAFNDKIEVSAKFSNNRDGLISDIKDLDFGNGTRLWDGLVTGLDELKGLDGRRVVLVFTDGDDTSSRASFGDVVDRARAEEVMIYAIGLESRFFDGQRTVRTRPDSGLKKLADETGGGYFELKESAELSSTFTKVAQELHSQYALAFEATRLDGKVHKLAVKMKQPGMIARARRSYLAEKDQATSTRP
jgi:Ca-activated chloride channel family protein